MKISIFSDIIFLCFIFSCNKVMLNDKENWLATAEEIFELCKNSNKKQMTQRLNFPARQDCAWGQTIHGVANLSIKDRYIRARSEEVQVLELPDDFVLCGVEINSTTTNLRYDDVLFFTMNDFLLVAGSNSFVPLFDTIGEIPIWNFANIRNAHDVPYPWDKPTYCLGGSNSVCVVPTHDVGGPFDLTIDPVSLSRIAAMTINDQKLTFMLIVTGDNDDEDCYHANFILDLKIYYINVPEE